MFGVSKLAVPDGRTRAGLRHLFGGILRRASRRIVFGLSTATDHHKNCRVFGRCKGVFLRGHCAS